MTKLYDRKWRVAIQTFRGDVIEIPTDLKVLFQVECHVLNYMSTGSVIIYNLTRDTETDVFKNAKTVIVEAGYQNGPYGVVYQGPVRQTLRGKEDGVHYWVKLNCINDALNTGFCSLVLTAGQTAEQIINQIARSSTVPFDIRIGPGLDKAKTERGKTIFAPTAEALRNIATNNNGFVFTDNTGQVKYDSVASAPTGDIPFLNYETGLIGTPQQEEQGISFQCLINPNIKLGSWVELNNQNILQYEVPLQGLQPAYLEVDGRYRIIEMVISGDTRGNEWYYNCTAIGAHNALPEMLQAPNQSGL